MWLHIASGQVVTSQFTHNCLFFFLHFSLHSCHLYFPPSLFATEVQPYTGAFNRLINYLCCLGKTEDAHQLEVNSQHYSLISDKWYSSKFEKCPKKVKKKKKESTNWSKNSFLQTAAHAEHTQERCLQNQQLAYSSLQLPAEPFLYLMQLSRKLDTKSFEWCK